MRFLSAAHTDIGITKQINQDSFCLKIAKTQKKNIAFSVLCDGMGGLKKGELASSSVVNTFSEWFEKELPYVVDKSDDFNIIISMWRKIIISQGKKIYDYGHSRGISLGTTITAILIIDDNYVAVNVGDSRIYKIKKEIEQITKDHTLVEYEVQQHKITAEQAKTDNRKNILLQCIGASTVIKPDFFIGKVDEEDIFLLCSDGFRHEILEEEMYGILAPQVLSSEKIMKKSLVDLIELNKSRNEKDNITAVLIKAIK